MKYGKLKGGLWIQIGLGIGFEGIRDMLDNWGEEWKAMTSLHDLRQSGINRSIPKISE